MDAPGRRDEDAPVSVELLAVPSLALDLARHPRGGDVAAVLLTALTLRPGDLEVLDAQHVDSYLRDRARLAVAVSVPVAAGGGRGASPDSDTLERALKLVNGGLLEGAVSRRGDLRVLRHPRALAVVGDALLAAWSADGLREGDLATLTTPLSRGLVRLPGVERRGVYDGPSGALLHSVCRVLRHADGATWRRLAARPESQAAGTWPVLMHQAASAALTTGRLRAAAAAQLLTVVAIHQAWPGAAAVEGGWNAVSAVAAALVVSDVLPDAAFGGLVERWVRATT